MRWFVCLLLMMTLLSAEEEFSLVNLTKSPIPRVAGSVNVISGHFVDQASHMQTSGPDPYTLAHSYTSDNIEEGSLSDGWDYFHPSDLEVFQPQGIAYVSKSPEIDWEYNYAKLYYRESGGATILFKGDQQAKNFTPKIHNTGYTLISSIDAPSRRDTKQTTITHHDHSDEWVVRLSDGTKRTYTRTKRFSFRLFDAPSEFYKRAYHIKEERLPSGNYRIYSYNSDHELKSIETVSSDKKQQLHKVFFKKDHHLIKVTSTDGLDTKISLKKLHDRENANIVSKITRPGKPTLSYSYSEKSKKHARRVVCKTIDSRTDRIKFYHKGKNTVNGSTITVKDHNIPTHVNRVREIWTHSFAQEPSHVSHAFSYSIGKDHGKAVVTEDDGCNTLYKWDKEKHPTYIGRHSEKNTLINAESYEWESGRLITRTVSDEQNRPILIRSFHYNHNGDVTKETLRGRFTSHAVSTMSFDKHDHLHGGEELVWKASYNDRHLKTGQCDPFGNWTFYEYESDRDLMTARFTCRGETIIRREFFTYDAAAICIEEILDDGSSTHKKHLTNVTRQTIHLITPRRATPHYGAPEEESFLVWTPQAGKQLVKKECFIRDANGLVTCKKLIDNAGNVAKLWHFTYDNLHRIIETSDPSGRVERFSYDSLGRLATKQTPESCLSYRYDLFDRVIEEKSTFPDGSVSTICREFSRSGRTVTQIDSRGRATTTCYDMAGRPVKKLLPAIASESGIKRPELTILYTDTTERQTSPTGAVTEILHSATGKPLVCTNQFGAKTYYRYDVRNRLIEQVDPSGLITTYEYDTFDRQVQISQSLPGQPVVTVTKRYVGFDLVEERHPTKTITYTYDEFGRKESETITDLLTGEAITIRTVYDTLHRPIRRINETLHTEECLVYDAADRVIERKVQAAGVLLSITTTGYDLAGRVVEEGIGRCGTIARTVTAYGTYGLPSSITMPDGTVTTCSYQPLYKYTDGLFYLQKITTDARGVTTEELLDANDQQRLVRTKDPFGTQIAKRTVFVSILGKPVLIEDDAIAQGMHTATIKTKLEYDSVGQMVSCTQAEGTPEQGTWHYTYDAMGRKVEEKKPSGTTLNSTYDAKNRLIAYRSSDSTVSLTYRYNVQDLPEEVHNETTGHATYRSYDGLGHVLSETLENGLCLKTAISATGHLRSITYPDNSSALYTYTYGQLSRIQRNGYMYKVIARDASGMITRASLPCPGELSDSIDTMGRRTSICHPAFSEHRTLFDEVGCLLERTVDGQHETFSYDFLKQLTSDNGRSALYDSIHRRLESEGKKAIHNARHQLLASGNSSLRYDIDGRRTADERFEYTYDALDRLIAVTNDTQRFEYVYDGFNRRISETLSGEKYLWLGDCEVGSVDTKGKILSLRILGEGLGGEIGAAVLEEINGKQYVPLHDLSGNVRICLDIKGNVAEKIAYTAFGVQSRTANISPWTFSSKREDSATGFIYFGRRVYDPATATWLTQDPLGHTAGPNLYAYVKNNPLMLVDIMGMAESAGGFWGGVMDTVCGVFSSMADMYPESDTTYENSFDRSESELPPTANDIPLDDGRVVKERAFYSDQALIYPDGSVEKFVDKHKGEDLDKNVYVHIPGMQTSLYESIKRCQQFIKMNDKITAVVVLYNATHSLSHDAFEALFTSLGFDMGVGKILRDEFDNLLATCTSNKISFSMQFVCHSQGVGIGANLRNHPEYKPEGQYGKMMGRMGNFGGPVFVPGAINYMAKGDPICTLALMHMSRQEIDSAVANGSLRFVESTTPGESPHDFAGSAYQSALHEFIHENQ